jgi:hypothetical protein
MKITLAITLLAGLLVSSGAILAADGTDFPALGRQTAALVVPAACLPDAPELGDLGPDSGRVCDVLEHELPGTTLAVDGRSIHSATAVTVSASVDGRPVRLDYRLVGLTWELDDFGTPTGGPGASRAASICLGFVARPGQALCCDMSARHCSTHGGACTFA